MSVSGCRIASLGLLLLVSGARWASCAPERADPNASYGVLAYVQGGKLCIRELPGGRILQVTTRGIAERPKWSPTGKWLLFEQRSADNEHYWERTLLVRRDGSDVRIVRGAQDAAWVGRHDEVVYRKSRSIWLSRAPDIRPERLAAMPVEHRNDTVSFQVSPDKRWIAFTRRWINWNREGTDWNRGTGVLWVQRPDGSQHRIVYDAKGRWDVLPELAGWSPDSRHVFMGTYVYMAGSGNLDGTPLYAFDAETGKRRSLAPNLAMKMGDWYAYSPDTSRIVVGDGGDRWGLGPKTLLVVDPRTWRSHRITDEATDSFFPAWSPDGKRFAFVENSLFRAKGSMDDLAFHANQLCVMSADGTHKKRVHRAGGNGIWYPMWCGDGRHIVFVVRYPERHFSLWVIGDDGKGLRKLVGPVELRGGLAPTEAFDFWAPVRAWNHR